jgi:hypothetical protein
MLFNVPIGKYIIDMMNGISNLESLELYVDPVYEGFANILGRIRLSQICNKNLNNFYKSRKYYIDLNIEDLKKNNTYFTNCDEFLLSVKIRFKGEEGQESYSSPGKIRFGFMYKYDKPESISEELYNSIMNKISILDEDSLYNFTDIVSDDINISNPLDSKSFLDKNHIYNEFTICQIDTNNSSFIVTNSK